MSGSWETLAPDELIGRLARWLADGGVSDSAGGGLVRILIDGPPCARPEQLSENLIEALRALGRPAVHVRASTFWRDASLRLEYGRTDLESYPEWLDTDALRREVLDAAAASARYLPSLRDRRTNRSTRAPSRPLAEGTVLIVSGALLLGRALPVERSVHLVMSPDARRRQTPEDEQWTLPAYEAYDEAVRPAETADVAVRVDRRHPATLRLP